MSVRSRTASPAPRSLARAGLVSAARVAVVVAVVAASAVSVAAPAFAKDDGEIASPLGFWAVVGWFVAIPVGVFLLIALLTYAPVLRRRPRYRPNRAWEHEAVWFAGPAAGSAALAGADALEHADVKGGGASARW